MSHNLELVSPLSKTSAPETQVTFESPLSIHSPGALDRLVQELREKLHISKNYNNVLFSQRIQEVPNAQGCRHMSPRHTSGATPESLENVHLPGAKSAAEEDTSTLESLTEQNISSVFESMQRRWMTCVQHYVTYRHDNYFKTGLCKLSPRAVTPNKKVKDIGQTDAASTSHFKTLSDMSVDETLKTNQILKRQIEDAIRTMPLQSVHRTVFQDVVTLLDSDYTLIAESCKRLKTRWNECYHTIRAALASNQALVQNTLASSQKQWFKVEAYIDELKNKVKTLSAARYRDLWKASHTLCKMWCGVCSEIFKCVSRLKMCICNGKQFEPARNALWISYDSIAIIQRCMSELDSNVAACADIMWSKDLLSYLCNLTRHVTNLLNVLDQLEVLYNDVDATVKASTSAFIMHIKKNIASADWNDYEALKAAKEQVSKDLSNVQDQLSKINIASMDASPTDVKDAQLIITRGKLLKRQIELKTIQDAVSRQMQTIDSRTCLNNLSSFLKSDAKWSQNITTAKRATDIISVYACNEYEKWRTGESLLDEQKAHQQKGISLEMNQLFFDYARKTSKILAQQLSLLTNCCANESITIIKRTQTTLLALEGFITLSSDIPSDMTEVVRAYMSSRRRVPTVYVSAIKQSFDHVCDAILKAL